MKHATINPELELNSEAKRTVKHRVPVKVKALVLVLLVTGCTIGLNSFFNKYYLVSPVILQSPVRERGSIYPVQLSKEELYKTINEGIDNGFKEVKVDNKILPTPTVKARENKDSSGIKQWSGQASVYTEEGCLGCSANLTMANGETFTNDKVIVAFNRTSLNKWVRVTNQTNGLFIEAKVADRGGFEKYGRIIDLGKATAEAINCKGLCQVTVEEI